MDELSLRVLAGIRRIKSIDIGKDDEEIRLRNAGDDGGKGIVVADFDFICRNSIVFIDHRDSP